MARKENATQFRYLAAGVFVRRVGDQVHVVTTADNLEPSMAIEKQDNGRGGTADIMAKDNWIAEQMIDPAAFAAALAELAPQHRGNLVNVAPDNTEPFLLTQSQAERHEKIVRSKIEAEVEATLAVRAAA